MGNEKTVSKGGLGFVEAIGLLFIGLRLCNVIDWPWIWVLSPLWIQLAILIIIGIVWAIVKYKNRIPCIFKGHDYQGKYEVTKFISGENHKYVTRCTRCGKVLR